jgi:hypothetical protein
MTKDAWQLQNKFGNFKHYSTLSFPHLPCLLRINANSLDSKVAAAAALA